MKVFNIMKNSADLEVIVNKVKQHQKEDKKLNQIRERLDRQEERATHYYCLHEDILFVKTKPNQNTWKLMIPKETAAEIIMEYHLRYGHMGALKVRKALEEHTYLKDINRRVRKTIRNCHICQLVKCNNDRKEGVMQPITSTNKMERVFLDICGPMP